MQKVISHLRLEPEQNEDHPKQFFKYRFASDDDQLQVILNLDTRNADHITASESCQRRNTVSVMC